MRAYRLPRCDVCTASEWEWVDGEVEQFYFSLPLSLVRLIVVEIVYFVDCMLVVTVEWMMAVEKEKIVNSPNYGEHFDIECFVA